MRKMVQADEARDLLLAVPARPELECVSLRDAVGRVLAEPFTARMNVPPFDKSPYDGYALRGEDTALASKQTPVTLTLTEELPAGTAPTAPLQPGQAAKILTGAPLPPGANTTVKYEITEFTDKTVTLFAPARPNTDVVLTGEDVREGELLAQAGQVIDPALAALMAGQGMAEAAVFRRAKIALLATGSELLPPGAPLEPAKIYDTNTTMLTGYLMRLGAEVVDCGIVEDDPAQIADKLAAALRCCDCVITTGGASVGDYDWSVRTAEMLGAEVLFWKTDMKPGGSIMAAVKDGKVILGLSGNPGAAVIGLQRIAMPYLKKLSGRTDVLPERFEAYLEKDYGKKSPKLRMLRGVLKLKDGRVLFSPLHGQNNGAIRSLVGCDVFGEIPAGSPPLPAGTKIWAYRLDV